MAPDPLRIPGKVPEKPEYNIEVEIDQVADGYYAESKRIPGGLPDSFDGQKITWFNNFGIKEAKNPDAGFVKGKIPQHYRVSMDLPAGKRLCIYDNTEADDRKKLKEITRASGPSDNRPFTYQRGNNNRISFFLDLGDPPSGMYP